MLSVASWLFLPPEVRHSLIINFQPHGVVISPLAACLCPRSVSGRGTQPGFHLGRNLRLFCRHGSIIFTGTGTHRHNTGDELHYMGLVGANVANSLRQTVNIPSCACQRLDNPQHLWRFSSGRQDNTTTGGVLAVITWWSFRHHAGDYGINHTGSIKAHPGHPVIEMTPKPIPRCLRSSRPTMYCSIINILCIRKSELFAVEEFSARMTRTIFS